jgi:hypothetical protein
VVSNQHVGMASWDLHSHQKHSFLPYYHTHISAKSGLLRLIVEPYNPSLYWHQF